MVNEKRRSDRVMLTIPLRVHGIDARGVAFKEEARTINLNRHGAKVETSRPLKSGQVVRLVNLVGHREADFRVVGPVVPLSEKGGQWAVECVNPNENIWGIQFPPLPPGSENQSNALLECRKCHSVSLVRVSIAEVEVLETAGILSKLCQNCDAVTPWGYAEKQVAMDAPPGEAAMLAEAQATATGGTRSAEQRRHRRVALQLPVLVRDYYGGVEITKSENVSKGGFCFASEKNYHVGEGTMVICPYDPAGQNIEIPARIVRRRELEGTHRKIYGVRYDRQV